MAELNVCSIPSPPVFQLTQDVLQLILQLRPSEIPDDSLVMIIAGSSISAIDHNVLCSRAIDLDGANHHVVWVRNSDWNSIAIVAVECRILAIGSSEAAVAKLLSFSADGIIVIDPVLSGLVESSDLQNLGLRFVEPNRGLLKAKPALSAKVEMVPVAS